MILVDAQTGEKLGWPAIGEVLPSGDVIKTVVTCGSWWRPTSASIVTESGACIPLQLRFLHPKFPLRWVGFIPS